MNSKITYHKVGDYYIPDLYLEIEEYKKDYKIGKYGHLRLQYLKNHKKAEYTIMFMNCKRYFYKSYESWKCRLYFFN